MLYVIFVLIWFSSFGPIISDFSFLSFLFHVSENDQCPSFITPAPPTAQTEVEQAAEEAARLARVVHVDRVWRSLASQPRVTRYNIPWDDDASAVAAVAADPSAAAASATQSLTKDEDDDDVCCCAWLFFFLSSVFSCS